MSQLSKRARSILYAVVTDYTATGEPVGSRTLAKKYGFDLSPATIRNVLADLEEAGYVSQPHTSAGRIPTEKAFRLFIDTLMRARQLSPSFVAEIAEHFEELPPGADILRETGRLLSNLTGAVSVVAPSQLEKRTLVAVRFIPTRPSELLAVIVLSDGAVENRYITVDGPLSSAELERVHNLLEEIVEGRTMSAVRDELQRRARQVRSELLGLLKVSQSLIAATVAGSDRGDGVVIEGQAKALESPEFSSADRVRELMGVLEEKEQLVLLLDRTIATERVQVFMGEDTGTLSDMPLSVVAAPFHEDGRPAGGLGIIGPTRMDYPTVVPLVGATASAVSAALSRTGRDGSEESDAAREPGDGDEPI